MIIEPYNVLKPKLLADGEQSLADEPGSISEPDELSTEATPPWGKRSRGTRHTSGIGSKMRGWVCGRHIQLDVSTKGGPR
jgi:hypothetical protein